MAKNYIGKIYIKKGNDLTFVKETDHHGDSREEAIAIAKNELPKIGLAEGSVYIDTTEYIW